MSFAVNKYGDTYVWGENRHNMLLAGSDSKNIVNVEVPTLITYP